MPLPAEAAPKEVAAGVAPAERRMLHETIRLLEGITRPAERIVPTEITTLPGTRRTAAAWISGGGMRLWGRHETLGASEYTESRKDRSNTPFFCLFLLGGNLFKGASLFVRIFFMALRTGSVT